MSYVLSQPQKFFFQLIILSYFSQVYSYPAILSNRKQRKRSVSLRTSLWSTMFRREENPSKRNQYQPPPPYSHYCHTTAQLNFKRWFVIPSWFGLLFCSFIPTYKAKSLTIPAAISFTNVKITFCFCGTNRNQMIQENAHSVICLLEFKYKE